MSSGLHEEKHDILAEILMLLSEQERSVREVAATGEEPDFVLRAKRIEDLLGEVGA
jgi:hypothetical protein